MSNASTELIRRIRRFEISRVAVVAELCREPRDELDLAFQTILRNRVQRGGILAPGASLMKNGENNVGVASRWYPETLARRIAAINAARNKIEFFHKDAFDVIPKYLRDKTATFFVDPPYTAGGKSAGRRLYLHSSIDHNSLFDLLQDAAGEVMLTYDDAKEVRDLATAHGFFIKPIAMKTTHHTRMYELATRITPLQCRVLTSPCACLKNRRVIERSESQKTLATGKNSSGPGNFVSSSAPKRLNRSSFNTSLALAAAGLVAELLAH